jgi:hypothetical protein
MPTKTQSSYFEAAPVRGAQSFVGIMAQVWKRPDCTALEIAWRWLTGVLIIACIEPSLGSDFGARLSASIVLLQPLSVFQPVAAIEAIRTIVIALVEPAWLTLRWAIPLAVFFWLFLAALGRTVTLRRFDPTLHARRLSLFVLGMLRATLLLFAWFIWFRGVIFAAHIAITNPAAHGQEPSVVLFAAMLISGTLVLYVLYGLLSWPFHLAPLLAMLRNLGPIDALRAAFDSTRVRGKLIEINLVMNIARIALIVLAMVASASPLPFTTVATQGFLQIWWCITLLVYLAWNDYFHVVRAASYLSLYRALEVSENPA